MSNQIQAGASTSLASNVVPCQARDSIGQVTINTSPSDSGHRHHRNAGSDIDLYPRPATNVCSAADRSVCSSSSHLPITASTTRTIDEPPASALNNNTATRLRSFNGVLTQLAICRVSCHIAGGNADVSMHLTTTALRDTGDKPVQHRMHARQR